MTSLNSNKIKINSNRSFALVFFVLFLIISLWPLNSGGSIKIWAASISIIFLILGLINSKLLTPLNILWFKFGIILGNIFSPIVMGVIFYLLVTPTGIILRIMQKDLLNIKYNKEKKSYWIKRNTPIGSMKKQF